MKNPGVKRSIIYALLIAGAIAMLMPFFWMVTTALKTPPEATTMPPVWIPEVLQWSNFVEAWNTAPFARYFLNSFFISITCTVLEVITAILAAYAFAKMQFFGKNVLFVILLGTMMIPGEVLLIPNFLTLSKLGWINTYKALIIPWIASVFAIFLVRQFFMTIPEELWEAARIDGCSRLRYLFQIMVPLAKPAIVTIALFKFIGSWNAFLWVLIMTNTSAMRTVPVGLSFFVSDVGTDYHLLMAASTFAMLPVLIIFLAAQKQFIQGIARVGIKG